MHVYGDEGVKTYQQFSISEKNLLTVDKLRSLSCKGYKMSPHTSLNGCLVLAVAKSCLQVQAVDFYFAVSQFVTYFLVLMSPRY